MKWVWSKRMNKDWIWKQIYVGGANGLRGSGKPRECFFFPVLSLYTHNRKQLLAKFLSHITLIFCFLSELSTTSTELTTEERRGIYYMAKWICILVTVIDIVTVTQWTPVYLLFLITHPFYCMVRWRLLEVCKEHTNLNFNKLQKEFYIK